MRSAVRSPHWPTRPATLMWMALVTVAVLVAACGRTSPVAAQGNTGFRASGTATPTLPPPALLTWVPATMPPGSPMLGLGTLGVLDIAPSYGNTAYACMSSAPASAQLNIWVTHDRALHWTRMAALPQVPKRVTFCWVIVDAVNPAIAVGIVSWAQEGMGPLPGWTSTFVTFNGGTSWQPLSGPGGPNGPLPFTMAWHATYDGITLAVLDTTVGGGTSALWISRDQMQTWQRTTAPSRWLQMLAINPATGDLLALDQASASTAVVEESHDEGQSWSQRPTPLDPVSLLVSPPVAQQPWRICGLTPDPNDPLNGGTLLCSMDGGQTWSERPRLVTTFINPSKGQFKETANAFAVAPDGTVLAAMPAIPFSSTPATLYRLAPTAQHWQSLGAMPNDTVTTTVLAGAGILWEAQLNTGANVGGLFA